MVPEVANRGDALEGEIVEFVLGWLFLVDLSFLVRGVLGAQGQVDEMGLGEILFLEHPLPLLLLLVVGVEVVDELGLIEMLEVLLLDLPDLVLDLLVDLLV